MAFCELKSDGFISDDVQSESDGIISDDSDDDPTFDVVKETKSRVRVSARSVKKPSKNSSSDDMTSGSEEEPEGPEPMDVEIPELDVKEGKCFESVEKLIKDGQLDKLKVDQCKVYLRKYGLRITGNKEVLIRRIREHLEIIDGCGEKKYPSSSFVINCKGDACTGDVVIFEQNVYEMFSIVSRSATAPPCGSRIVAGRIVKESYGAAKQQHTFTIEVLWSKGEKPLPPLHPLLIKGRNLYRLKTMRQKWVDEGERWKVLQEKHSRGSLARCSRENRIHEKEARKMARANRTKENQSEYILLDKRKQPQVNLPKTDVLQQHKHPQQVLQFQQNKQHQVNLPKTNVLQQNMQHQQELQFQQHMQYQVNLPKTNVQNMQHHQELQSQQHMQCQVNLPNTNVQNMLHQQELQSQQQMQPKTDVSQLNLQQQQEFHCHMNLIERDAFINHLNNQHLMRNMQIKQQFPGVSDNLLTIQQSQEFQGHGGRVMKPQFHANVHQFHSSTALEFPQRQPLSTVNSLRDLPQQQQMMMKQKLCRFYRERRCRFGDNCKYLHDSR